MSEKELQSPYPMAPANGHARSDTEAGAGAAAHDSREQRKKKRTKCLLYIVLFVVFQTAVITLFALTIMKIRTPKFRLRSATFTDFSVGNSANPSFTTRMNADLAVKNANFGRYKYRSTAVTFSYRGTPIGEVTVPNSRANWRSTKKIDAVVDLNLNNARGNPQFGSDLSSGVLTINSAAKMRGRVELMFVMKKNRGTDMNCSMEIVLATQQLRNIVCK